MGHRIYDPRLTRFLQADPLIEDGSTLNRYTYVHNDPLAYTDPSGYLSLRQFVRTAVAVAISVWSGGALAGAAWAGVGTTISSAGFMTKLAFAMSNGLLAGAFQSGTVEGAAWGTFSAGVFFGIGQGLAGAGQWAEGSFMGLKLSGAGFAVKTVSHGLAGGTISHLQGGKFGHGFVSAAGSAATAPLVDASSANVVRGAVVTTLVGGTLSRISGGNFANGALTAAMSYAFNQVASSGFFDGEYVSAEQMESYQKLFASHFGNPAIGLANSGVMNLIPGMGVLACMANGCSGTEWALQSAAVLPVGRIANLGAKLPATELGNFVGAPSRVVIGGGQLLFGVRDASSRNLWWTRQQGGLKSQVQHFCGSWIFPRRGPRSEFASRGFFAVGRSAGRRSDSACTG